MTTEKIYDVIVIGSGGGGLAAATVTSKAGAKTLMIEAMPFIGGYLNPFKRKNYEFDTGLHYLGELGEKGSFYRRLKKLGVTDKVKFLELNPNGFCEYHFGDMKFVLPKGKENFKKNVLELFPQEEKAVNNFMSFLNDMEESVALVSSGAKSLKNSMKLITKLPKLKKYMTVTYQQILDEITDNKDLKYIFSIMSGEAGLPPSKASPFTALILSHYLSGAFYPEGGSGALRDAFVSIITENNGEIKKSTKAEKIYKSSGLFVVETNKGTFKSKKVISDVDPKIVFNGILDEELIPAKLKKKAVKAEPSLGSFYAFVGTKLDLTEYGFSDANLIHADNNDIDESFFSKWDQFNSFFITVPSLKDPGNHAPKGFNSMEIISAAPFEPFKKWADLPSMKRGEEYENYKRELGFRLLKKVEKYIPGLTENLDFIEFGTPLSNLYWVNAPYGGSYGLNQIPSQMGPGRFSIKTDIEGFFLCGASTLGGGVSPAIASGEIAGKMAIKNL